MAIGDILTKVLTRYEADVSQEKRALEDLIRKNEELKNKEQEAANARERHFDQLVLDASRAAKAQEELVIKWDETAKQFDKTKKSSFDIKDIAAGWYTFKEAIGVVGQAISAAQGAIKGWGEDIRMDATNAGISIDHLNESFQGLIDDDTINQFAAKTANGALKLTQQQMEQVAQAAVALRERGFDLAHSLDVLTDAAVTGRTKGLHELGLEVEEGGNRIQTTHNYMQALNKVIADSHGPTSKAADDIERLSVAWDNAKDAAKNYAAEAIIATTQSFNAMQAARDMGWAGFLGNFTNANSFQNAQYQMGLRGFAGGFVKGKNREDNIEMDEDNLADDIKAAHAKAAQLKKELDALGKKLLGTGDKSEIAIKQGEYDRAAFAADVQSISEQMGRQERYDRRSVLGDNTLNGQVDFSAASASVAAAGGQIQALQAAAQEMQKSLQHYKPEEHLLKKLGIPNPSEWDAARAGMEAFANSIGPALDQIAQGHLTAGKAAKMVAGQTIHALGDTLAQKAAAEAVEGAAMLVTLNPAGGLHLAAAGILGAGAVAAYAAASRLGAGGGSAPAIGGGGSGGGAAAPATSGTRDQRGLGAGSTHSDRPIVLVVGEAFGEMSVRERSLAAQRKLQQALGGPGGEHD
jgi:hypothetical protein